MFIINTKHDFNAALIGMILFDGSMVNDHCLYLRHGGNQLQYVDEKVNIISKYIVPNSIRTSVDKLGYTYRYAYYNNNLLKYLYNDIYKQGRKTLTKNILNRFNSITLAIMYMDNGCLCLRKDPKYDNIYKSREIHLNVQSFTPYEVNMLQAYLRNVWDIDFHYTTDKGKPKLWCNTSNTIKFLNIAAPIVINFPSMHYKLDLKYKTKDINFLK